jgi:hypothetical protein
MLKTFEIHYRDVNESGDVTTFSYMVLATSWEEAEKRIPATHWVNGRVISVIDEESGLEIDLTGNLN